MHFVCRFHPMGASPRVLCAMSRPRRYDVAMDRHVWTVGHSTHALSEFVDILQAHGIETVADVRRFPGSRRHPQFGAEALDSALAAHGIGYHWFGELGGRRRPDFAEPEGSAWRHPSFRAYAQYLRSEEFAQGLDSLVNVAS